LKKGETADFKVIEFNKNSKRLHLTLLSSVKKKKNVKTATEKSSSASAANASTFR
jgi:small subunit ribosomal protein S1